MKHSTILFSLLFLTLSNSADAMPVSWGAIATSALGSCSGSCFAISPNQEIGGGMNANVSSEVSDSRGLSQAQATLDGSSFTPVLKAFAMTNPGNGVAFSTATGVQSYTNNGPARTITLDLTLSASVSGNDSGASARIGVFLTDELSQFSRDFGTTAFEIGSDTLIGRDTPNDDSDDAWASLFISSSNTPTNTSIDFHIDAGQDFLIWAGLQADSKFGGTADAFNTFTMNFDDDTGLLAASVANTAPVPLPATIWLFLVGIGAITSMLRGQATAA